MSFSQYCIKLSTIKNYFITGDSTLPKEWEKKSLEDDQKAYNKYFLNFQIFSSQSILLFLILLEVGQLYFRLSQMVTAKL